MSEKNKILFIAPYKEMADMVVEVAKQYDIEVRVEIALMEDAMQLAKKAQNEGAEIVISRGATLAAIKKECSLPIVEIYENNLEILRAIQEALTYGKNLALIWYNEIPYNEGFLYTLLQVDVRFYRYETKDEIKKLVNTAIKEKADVIIGGAYTVHFAEKLGKKGVIVGCDKESILWTLRQAQSIVNIKKEEEIKRKRIETIIQNVHDGIIAVDQQGIITTFNPMAEAIMKLKADDVVGKYAKDVIPNTRLYETFKGENQLDQLQDVGSAIISTNRVKMKIKDETVGVVATFQDVTRIQQLEQKIRQNLYSKGHVAHYKFEDIVGNSPALISVKNIAKKFAQTDETILILGESGTGKEMFAQSIHNGSQRINCPFVAVNCAELSESLFESELFGYEEGAFTGARRGGKEGLFLLAHKGTIFLDEISELPLPLQTAILRVIQEKTIRPVGSDKIIPVDVRIIAASNKNLKRLVDEAKFRQDLFYRLNVLTIRIPSLKERKSDIPELIKTIAAGSNQKLHLDGESLQKLMSYDWPGNVRELLNVIRRLMVLYGTNTITKENLLEAMPEVFDFYNNNEVSSSMKLGGNLNQIIKNSIEKAMEITKGNQTEAAKMLGVSRTFLWRKLRDM
ncbi:MAG: sigma 54-interacting transcriptional regulator [Lutisporaceae bacterium]